MVHPRAHQIVIGREPTLREMRLEDDSEVVEGGRAAMGQTVIGAKGHLGWRPPR